MKDEISINVDNVTKSFKISGTDKSVFGVLSSLGKSPERKIRPVLNDISFQVSKGEMFRIIGSNGAGKTTLLRLIARTIRPDSGSIITYGKIIPMLELGTGFDYELSAVENIIVYGTVLGLRKNEIQLKIDDILEFAELRQFANQKLKTFSSGMISRLAFSTARQIQPDILLIDEILSVGDIVSRKRVFKRFSNLKKKAKQSYLSAITLRS